MYLQWHLKVLQSLPKASAYFCANNGPEQAPVIDQPKPRINPPYICPLLNVFVGSSIFSQ